MIDIESSWKLWELTVPQIVIYVFARVVLAIAKLSVEPNMHPLSHMITPEARAQITDNAWPVFASLSWAFVMYIFRWYPDTLISSLRSSMYYMYVVTYPVFVLFYVMLIVIQLRRLRPLGLLPELLNTQQIEQTLRSDSCALVYRLGTGLFWFIFMCDLFLLYIVLRWLVVIPQALFSPCYSFNISTINYHWCL